MFLFFWFLSRVPRFSLRGSILKASQKLLTLWRFMASREHSRSTRFPASRIARQQQMCIVAAVEGTACTRCRPWCASTGSCQSWSRSSWYGSTGPWCTWRSVAWRPWPCSACGSRSPWSASQTAGSLAHCVGSVLPKEFMLEKFQISLNYTFQAS